MVSPSVYCAAFKAGIPVLQTIHNFRLFCPGALCYREGKICTDCIEGGLRQGIKHKCYRDSLAQTLALSAQLFFHRLKKTYRRLNYICLTEKSAALFKRGMGRHIDPERVFVKPNFPGGAAEARERDHQNEGLAYDEVIRNAEGTEAARLKNPAEQSEPAGLSRVAGRTEDGGFERPAEYSEVAPSDYFLYLGRLEISKGVRWLLAQWQDVKGERLIIAGTGSLEEEVRRASEKNNSIRYLGGVSHEKALELIRLAKALIFPSEWLENFPMVIAEAMSLGTPVITRDIGNGAELVRSAAPELVLKENESLAALLKAFDREKYTRRFRQEYEEKYTPGANLKRMEEIFTRLGLSVRGDSK